MQKNLHRFKVPQTYLKMKKLKRESWKGATRNEWKQAQTYQLRIQIGNLLTVRESLTKFGVDHTAR